MANKKGLFDFKIKYDNGPVTKGKNVTLDDLENAVKSLRRKFE